MTDEQINVAIAIHLNWQAVAFNAGIGVIGIPPARNECDPVRLKSVIWTKDLNAMHEAEKVLTEVQCVFFRTYLRECLENHPASLYVWHATARQRAEAFLRTVGKWKEAQND